MASINLLGDLSELRANSVNFNIAIELRGLSGHLRCPLATQVGIRPFLVGRAFARIGDGPLLVKVTGSVSTTKSINVHLCIIPTTEPSAPQTDSQVASVPGSCFAQHSVTASGTPASLTFPDGVTSQLKPPPVWGEPPDLVIVYEILGGTADSRATLKVSGHLEVGGLGFVKTW